VRNVRPERGYDYLMLGTGLEGSVDLEPLGPQRRSVARPSP
jgi:hypothetical protein